MSDLLFAVILIGNIPPLVLFCWGVWMVWLGYRERTIERFAREDAARRGR
jgi:hypothetical protein